MAQAAILLLLVLLPNISHAFHAAIHLTLVGDREIIIIPHEEVDSEERSNLHATCLVHAIKLLAISFLDKKIYFSFQSPSVYDAGDLLLENLRCSKSLLEKERYLSLLAKVSGTQIFSAQVLPKSLDQSFFSVHLLEVLANLQSTFWPANLEVRSNDPRREYLLSLIKDKKWLLANQKTLRLRDFITISPELHLKHHSFGIDSELEPKVKQNVLRVLKDFFAKEENHLRIFAKYASIKSRQHIDLAFFQKSIASLLPIISLEMLFEFLNHAHDRDIYADGPIIDTLFTVFDHKHPDKMVVISDPKQAINLVKTLDQTGAVTKIEYIPDTLVFISQLAVKTLYSDKR